MQETSPSEMSAAVTSCVPTDSDIFNKFKETEEPSGKSLGTNEFPHLVTDGTEAKTSINSEEDNVRAFHSEKENHFLAISKQKHVIMNKVDLGANSQVFLSSRLSLKSGNIDKASSKMRAK